MSSPTLDRELAVPPVVGPVALRVASLPRSIDFYRRALGLRVHREAGRSAALGAGGDDLVLLEEQPDAARAGRTTGLYHFALLLPSRRALAQQLWRLLQGGVRPQGVADHLVSEALYLADPDGNGIELYRDRPRADWLYDGDSIRMTTDPLDLDGLLAEIGPPAERLADMPPETTMGHVHLRVSDLAAAEAFYRDVLGFDVMARLGGSAAFLSRAGYHHHVGLNTWESRGAPAPPAGALGLRHVTFHLPVAEVSRARAAAAERGLAVEEGPDGLLLRDPAGNLVTLVSSPSAVSPAAP